LRASLTEPGCNIEQHALSHAGVPLHALPPPVTMNRQRFLRLAAGAGAVAAMLPLSPGAAVPAALARMHTRAIPASGEALPVVGCGTWRTFDVGPAPAARAPLREVLQVLFDHGGSVIDSSPMYGPAEGVVGDLLTAMHAHERAFLATKVWTQGREAGLAQMRTSLHLLQAPRIDLLQVHNLVDWRTQLTSVRAWQREGRVRYCGITHYTPSAYRELEAVMREARPDFVQLDYAADDRAAEATLLPLATDLGIAVIVNQPFGGGGLLRRLAGRPLPAWAADIGCTTWAQVLLKFVLGHPAVTCVIPGTGRPDHMRDNVQAGFGAYPDAALRQRIAQAVAR
jgi:diketogulonate reductase-like aldo/keto reductase